MTTTGPEPRRVPRILTHLLAALLGAAVGVGAIWLWQADELRREGYRIGLRHGEVKAARQGPPQVRDVRFEQDTLSATPAWRGLGELAEGEAEELSRLLHGAPSPCWRLARRGHSVAATLADDALDCPGVEDQVRLALTVLRTFPGDRPEALAALRVERRARPALDGRPLRGNPDADVVVVEYADFECPYCTRAQALTAGLLEERPDVGVAFKHLPLSFHPAALPAALAAEAAGEQGRFWEMHDALFDLGSGIGGHVNPDDPVPAEGPVPYEGLAAELGLDTERFRRDFRSPELRARVDADRAEARALGVSGTPTFIVDGRRVEERLSVRTLTRLVDKARAERDWRFSWDLDPPPPGSDDDDSAEADVE